MRAALAVLVLAGLVHAEWNLYACIATTKNYVVGARLLPSGLFARSATGEWKQIGHSHPFAFSMDYQPSVLFLATGNGLIRMRPDGTGWTHLTGSDVTELRDVAVDPHNAETVYFAHVAGIRVTRDGGKSWSELGEPLRRKYTEAVRADRGTPGVLVIANEEGIFRSADGGRTWELAGAAGFQALDLEQSPHDACHWIAATERGGLFVSRDCARTFENAGALGVGRNLYDVAFDPGRAGRIGVAGWGVGVLVSEDDGRTWSPRNGGLPSTDIWSFSFDPQHPGRIYAGVHEEALYRSDDDGRTWKADGLPGSVVYRLRFVR